MKHTPGPWKYTVDPNGENFHLEMADGEERIIGGCGCCGSPWMGGEVHANARLIAAAPEMYDYIAAAASNGCEQAKRLIANANATGELT